MNGNHMTIGPLARQAGLGVEAIRYYQRRGLLDIPRPSNGGYRTYNGQHLERLQFIKRAQALGFTLEQIGDLLRLDDLRDRHLARTIAQGKIADIQAHIKQLQSVVAALRHLVVECEHGTDGEPCPIIRMALPNDLPSR